MNLIDGRMLLSCFLCLFFCANTLNAQPFKPKTRYTSSKLVIQQISPNTYVHVSYLQTNDFGNVPCNGLVVRNEGQAVIFDTPTNDSASNELIQWVKQSLKCNIVGIVPTHFHDDCLGGLKAFHQERIPSFANFKTIQLAKANDYTLPQKGFTDSLQIKLGNQAVWVRYFGEGHTKDNVVGYFAKDQVLFGGCLIKELGATKGYLGDANVKSWSNTVSNIKQRLPNVQTVVPGHGAIGNQSLLDYTIQLFKSEQKPALISKIDGAEVSETALDQKIDSLMRVANVSGMAISVFNLNKPIYSKTFGWADVQKQLPLTPNTVLYGASFAKAVFAYIAMQLIQEGLFELDKPLVNYLKQPLPAYQIPGWRRGYQDVQSDERYKKITARMCLTHTTGFPNWRWFEADKKLKIKFEPGSRYSYSGEGLYLLQFVIEQLTGTDYETIVKQRVCTPLNLTNTSHIWQPAFEQNKAFGHNANGMPYELMRWKEASAGGSMSTTLADYSAFFAALMSSKDLSKQSFDTMVAPQIRIRSMAQFGPQSLVDGTENDAIELGYGLGVGVFKTPYGRAFFKEGHDDGWGHYSICFPDKQIGIVIMTNTDTGESIFKELLAFAIGDTFTPWRWENYIPYNFKQ